MRLRHRHRVRNIAIGSIIAAVSASAATYAIYRFMERKRNNENTKETDGENEKIIESASEVLINKIGATNSEVEEAKLLSMTAFDLAKDKGFSEEQLKMFINQERVRPIDELILNRKISHDIGEQVKEKIIQNTDSWNGSL